MGRREDARATFDRCLRESDEVLVGLLAAEADLIGDFTLSPRLVLSKLVNGRLPEPSDQPGDLRSAS